MMKILNVFSNLIEYVNEWVGRVCGFFIITLMFLVFCDVCGRYFFNRPIQWGLEVCGYQLVTIVFLGGGYTFLHGAHVKVDIIYGKLSPRAQAVMDIITSAFIFLVCIVLIRFGFEAAWKGMMAGHRSSSAAETLMWPSYFAVPIGAVLLGLQCLVKWIRDWCIALGGTKVESKVYTGKGGLRG